MASAYGIGLKARELGIRIFAHRDIRQYAQSVPSLWLEMRIFLHVGPCHLPPTTKTAANYGTEQQASVSVDAIDSATN